jgi:hypothetical protein
VQNDVRLRAFAASVVEGPGLVVVRRVVATGALEAGMVDVVDATVEVAVGGPAVGVDVVGVDWVAATVVVAAVEGAVDVGAAAVGSVVSPTPPMASPAMVARVSVRVDRVRARRRWPSVAPLTPS